LSRGKKRIGYELEVKLKLKGVPGGRWDGIECSIDIEELCDDGSDPQTRLYITKEGANSSGNKFRSEANSEKLIEEVVEKCREVLAMVRDEA